MKGIFTQGARLGVGHAAIDPALGAGAVAAAHNMVNISGDKPSAVDTGGAIEMISARVAEGDLSDLQDILVGQAVAMNIMGLDMISRARKNGTADALNTLAATGLRAIAQSRAAIDSLVNLKHPRSATFIKQANVAHGAQQINNNEGAPSSRVPAHEAVAPNGLLLQENASQTLEPGAARRAGGRNQTMEAVEVGDRSTKRGGKKLGLA